MSLAPVLARRGIQTSLLITGVDPGRPEGGAVEMACRGGGGQREDRPQQRTERLAGHGLPRTADQFHEAHCGTGARARRGDDQAVRDLTGNQT
jgi:hypothetical protein